MERKFAIIHRPHGSSVERDESTLHLTGDDVAVIAAALYVYAQGERGQLSRLYTPAAVQTCRDEIARAEQIREFLVRHGT